MKNFIVVSRIFIILSLSSMLLLITANNSIYGQSSNITTVTSAGDDGPGTLRSALQNAKPGIEIKFDPQVFPMDDPAAILLESPLPPLATGGVTINGQGAGVMVDGSSLGNEPELALLDDITLSLEGRPNLLLNGDFSAESNLDHWHFWQATDADNFRWNASEGAGAPGAFEWTGSSRQQIFSLTYSTEELQVNGSGSGEIFASILDDSFLDLDGARTLELSFWHRHGNFITNLIYETDGQGWVFQNFFTPAAEFWDMAVIRSQVPETAKRVALQIQINPANNTTGLEIYSNNNILQGLAIVNFPGVGVNIKNGQDNRIGGSGGLSREGCRGACNLISGNMMSGIHIEEGGGNIIQGNYFGVDRSGGFALPNRMANISIHASSSNQVGGIYSLGEGNLISGSDIGISISREEGNPAADNNIIQGNLVGTDLLGTGKLGNEIGILLVGCSQTVVGGPDPDLRNIISGNGMGVALRRGANANLLSGNYIGMDISGLLPLGNLGDGVEISEGSFDNRIGGLDAGAGNIISGNGQSGIHLFHKETSGNILEGNYLGSGKDPTKDLPNSRDGVTIEYAQNNQIGPANVIAHNGKDGIKIFLDERTNRNTITQNSISDNGALAINITTVPQQDLPAASDIVVSLRTVDGIAPAASVVEIYQDPREEAGTYLGTALADDQGRFNFTAAAGTTIAGNITVLVTNSLQGTGTLSSPFSPPASYLKEIPGFSSPEQISLQPQVILLNSGIAILAMLIFGIMATWFNETLECFSPEISKGFQDVLQRFHLLSENRRDQHRKYRTIRILVHWLIILGFTSIIQSFLDPKIQFDQVWLGQIGTLIFSGLFITGIQIITEIVLRRLSADKPDVEQTEVSRIGLMIASLSVGFSRLLNFSPGIILGTVDGLYCTPRLEDDRQNAQRALTSKGVVVVVTFIGWLLSPLFSHSPGTQALLITMFVIGIQYAFYELFPLKVLDGYSIREWNRWIWGAAFLISAFGFIYLVLNPDQGDLRAFRENQLYTLAIIAAFLVMMVMLMKVLLKRLEQHNARFKESDEIVESQP